MRKVLSAILPRSESESKSARKFEYRKSSFPLYLFFPFVFSSLPLPPPPSPLSLAPVDVPPAGCWSTRQHARSSESNVISSRVDNCNTRWERRTHARIFKPPHAYRTKHHCVNPFRVRNPFKVPRRPRSSRLSSANCNITSAVELLPETLLKFLRVLPAVIPSALRALHRHPMRVFRVHQRREALRHRRLERFQGSYYKVSDKASFLKCLFSILPVRRLDLEFPV